MLTPLTIVVVISVSTTVLWPRIAAGQSYPNKPIRIVTSGIGGSSDFASRLIATGISTSLGQPVTVDNRPTGVIPGEVVSKAAPDGYTLLIAGTSFWIGPLLQKTPYDPVRDFAPITLVTRAPAVLVVHPSLPVKSVKELIVLAKARPGELNYSSSAAGSSSHLAAALFEHKTDIRMTRIPYKNSSVEMADLIGGQIQLTFATAASVAQHLKSGRLRALAVTSAEQSSLFPGLPTVATAVPGYEYGSMQGAFAPASTPEAIINQLNQEIVRFLKSPEAREKFLNSGVDTVGTTVQQFAAAIKSDIANVGKVIKDAGIRAE